jgi:16S rRNA C967 or C1407 C5-methylase (RsmB/RsmF family)
MREKGKAAFLKYYQGLFPEASDYLKLEQALKTKRNPVLLLSQHHKDDVKELWKKAGLTFQPVPWWPDVIFWPKEVNLGVMLPGFVNKWFYPLSLSSLLPVKALDIKPTDMVLDACSAPGGKALLILNKLDSGEQLLANELSYKRALRLKKVLQEMEHLEVKVNIGPAERLMKRLPIKFDKILVDAPCSSEQHVINSPKHLNQWSKKRIEKLERRQIKMVFSLLPLLKPGGRLVYSTCAITPEENEQVVEAVLKNNIKVKLLPWEWPELPGGRGFPVDVDFDLNFVRRIRPEVENLDPMFVAIFEK